MFHIPGYGWFAVAHIIYITEIKASGGDRYFDICFATDESQRIWSTTLTEPIKTVHANLLSHIPYPGESA